MMQEREGKHEEERGDSKREPEKVTQAAPESTEPDEEETDMVQWYGDGLQ
jgi:hypothetical protein